MTFYQVPDDNQEGRCIETIPSYSGTFLDEGTSLPPGTHRQLMLQKEYEDVIPLKNRY